MENDTIDDMPKISGNFTDEVYEPRLVSYERIFLEMFTIAGLLSVIANVLISFVILKYKKMRQDPTNVIFLHVNILQAVYLLVTPLTLRVTMELLHLSRVYETVFCVSYQLEITMMFALSWFLFLLVCDWFLKLYFKDAYVKFRRVYKFFVVALYVLFIFMSSITVQYCLRNWMVIYIFPVLVGFVGLLVIFIIVINVIHAIKKRKIFINNRRGSFGLAMANVSILVWVPALIFAIFSVLGLYMDTPILLIIVLVLGFSSPIFNILYLYFYDDLYNVFLKQVFTCKCSQYENEELESHSVVYNDANGVQIQDR